MIDFETRVGAYGVILDGGWILLAQLDALGASKWALPGGGLQLAEDGEAAAVREIREETGYVVVPEGVLGVDSVQIPPHARIDGRPRHLHALRLIYRARIVGGALARETGGSTVDVQWFRLDDVSDLERVDLVDAGIRLWNQHMAEDRGSPRTRAGGSSAA